eukprot:2586458-Karenia_brevis.AAC.1
MDNVQCIECPYGTCSYEFADVNGFYRHLFQSASEEHITSTCKVRVPVASEAVAGLTHGRAKYRRIER